MISHSCGQLSLQYDKVPSSSWFARTNPPKIAGATLSGCPSTSVAIAKRAASSAGEPRSLLAANKPPTITDDELPKPLAIGI